MRQPRNNMEGKPSTLQSQSAAGLPRMNNSSNKRTRRGPSRAEVFDVAGNRIAKIRGGAMYSLQGEFFGRFINYERGTYLSHQGEVLAVLNDDRLFSANGGEHLGTLRRSAIVGFVVYAVVVVFLLALSLVFAYRFIPLSTGRDIDIDYVIYGNSSSYQLDIDVPAAWSDGEGELIAPGMEGEFVFTIYNGCLADLSGMFTFGEENEAGIDMRYRVRCNGQLISGEEYVPIEQLEMSAAVLPAGQTSVFELEWYWSHNDPVDTWVGENDAYYAVLLSFNAVPSSEQTAL